MSVARWRDRFDSASACVLLACLVVLPARQAHAAEPVARFGVIEGVVSVQRAAAGRFAVAVRGGELEEGDLVVTQKDSLAQIVFSDGGQVALRANSRLSVTRYHYDAEHPAEDSLVLDLLRGGLRTLTGLIGKRGDKSAYRMRLQSATIGIRGTDFLARICEADCAAEQGALSQQRLPVSAMPVVVARIAELSGRAAVVRAERAPDPIALGAALYNGDTVEVEVGAHATLLFTDDSRVVLGGGSRFQISNYRLDATHAENNVFLVSLVRGGLRTVTGLIGKLNPQHVAYRTASATVGIRGTEFDLRCAPLGEAASAPPAVVADCDQALLISMREGQTVVVSGDHSLNLGPGQSAIVNGPGAVPELLPGTPGSVQQDPLPIPEQLDLNDEAVFGPPSGTPAQGVYAAVFEGSIVLSQGGKDVVLGPGEAGFAAAADPANPAALTDPIQLGDVPGFMRNDTFLQNFDFDAMACIVQ